MKMQPIMNPNVQIDWTGCELVERIPARMSNVPILKGTRVQADSIVENFWDGSPVEEISENFNIPEATIQSCWPLRRAKRTTQGEGDLRPQRAA